MVGRPLSKWEAGLIYPVPVKCHSQKIDSRFIAIGNNSMSEKFRPHASAAEINP